MLVRSGGTESSIEVEVHTPSARTEAGAAYVSWSYSSVGTAVSGKGDHQGEREDPAQQERGQGPEQQVGPAEPAEEGAEEAGEFHVAETWSGGGDQRQRQIADSQDGGGERCSAQLRPSTSMAAAEGEQGQEHGIHRSHDGVGDAEHGHVVDDQEGARYGERSEGQ